MHYSQLHNCYMRKIKSVDRSNDSRTLIMSALIFAIDKHTFLFVRWAGGYTTA